MTEREWTPGPWQAEGPNYFGDFDILPPDGTVDASAVATVIGSQRPAAEVAANARLIAAAPDLYGALWNVREMCVFDDDNGQIGVSEDVVIPSGLFNQICAALARAEGRS